MPKRDNKTESEESSGIESATPSDEIESVPQVLVVEDEYGDPIIQGAYSGRDQLNLDALLPGRQEGDEEETPRPDDEGVSATAKLAQKKAFVRSVLGITFGAPLLIWLFLMLTPRSILQKQPLIEAPVTQPIHSDKIKDMPGAPFAAVLSAALERSAHADQAGADLLFQQCAALAATRDQAMQLIGLADTFVAKKQPKLAELFYRRALQVLGLSSGATSWEYLQSLTKLSMFCRNMNRIKEAEDIDAYIMRLTTQPAK